MALKLADDRMCFGCGSRNSRGLKLQFAMDESRQRIHTDWTPAKEHQGYADVVHGGMIGLVLDELMVNLLWKLDLPSVTAEMSFKFHRPARVGQPLSCEAWIAETKGQSGRVHRMEALAQDSKGRPVARAQATCVRV